MSPTRLLSAAAALALISAPCAALAQTPASTPAAAPAGYKTVVANGGVVDTLKLNGQFTVFTKGLADTNLAVLFNTNPNLTVFAPTDAAFAAMPPADLAKLTGDKAAMQKFLLHHVINLPWPSSKIKGVKGPVPSGLQDNILLDGSEEGGPLKVDGATIIQADIKTSSGLLYVVDHPLIAGQGNVEPPAEAAPAAASAAAPAPAATTPAKKQ
jgi:uncharacterized surface protein with fasciclin (FAS1) repeats